ncbi:MAG: hypothetical protein K8T91_03390 [Planctomycetes bacterium]|nr:hypothetical protein [Planctomycetota bacterium]
MSAGVVILTVILIVAFMVGSLGVILLFRFTFQPMQRPRSLEPTRFVLADILVLMTMLQPGLALMLVGNPEEVTGRVCLIVLALMMSVGVIFGWFSGVRTLSSNRVMATPRRVVYLLFAGPLATLGCIVAGVALLFLTIGIFSDVNSMHWRAVPEMALFLLILTGSGAVLFTLAILVVRWVARGAEGKSAVTPTTRLNQTPLQH